MKVLQVIGHGSIGGAEVFFADLASALQRRHHLDIAACFAMSWGPVADRIAGLGVPCTTLDMRRGFDAARARRLRQIVRDGGFDLVHSHSTQALIRLMLSTTGVPTLFTEHGAIAVERRGWRRIETVCRAAARRRGTRFVTVSEAARLELARQQHVPLNEIRVVPNGVDFRRLCGGSEPGTNAEPAIGGATRRSTLPGVGTLARLVPGKGIDHLIEAARLLWSKGLRFRTIIGGDGPCRPLLEEQARSIPEVHFTGEVREPGVFFKDVDVFVVPSRWESCSLATVEAMLLGKAVVVYGVGGLPEVVRDGETGRVVSPRRPAALAAAVGEFLEPGAGETLRMEAGRRASVFARERYGIERAADRYFALYNEMLGGE